MTGGEDGGPRSSLAEGANVNMLTKEQRLREIERMDPQIIL